MKKLATGISAVLALCAPVFAQDEQAIDQTKHNVEDPAICERIESDGVNALDEDFLSMSFADGIQSFEFHCNFFDVKTRENSSALLVEAFCEYPGEQYPDLLAITPYGEDRIQVVSMSERLMGDVVEDGMPGQRIFHRCENVSELPRE